MKVFLLFSYLLLAASLFGCGAKQSNLNLKVTGAFALSAAGYTGGLIAYGEGPGGAKFSISSSSSSEVSTALANGTWKVYIVGWEDASAAKFRGTSYCGGTTVNLTSSDTNVSIPISEANCSNGSIPEIDFNQIYTHSCGAFYKYNDVTDTFLPLTSAVVDDSFCTTLPGGLRTTHPYFKVASLNFDGSKYSRGFSSACIPTGTSDYLNLPSGKIPLEFMTFNSLADCNDTATPQRASKFEFRDGLSEGNRDLFDHSLITRNTTGRRLVLPSSRTKRGTSPLIGLMPRILCGTNDSNKAECFKSPILPTFSVNTVEVDVPWHGDSTTDLKVVKSGFLPTSTTTPGICETDITNFLSSSPLFNLKACEVRNGNLKARFTRHELLCRKADEYTNVINLYEKNNRTYIVRNIDANTIGINVYNVSGSFLGQSIINDAGILDYKSMAARNNGDLVIIAEDGGPHTRLYHIPLVSDDGNYIYYSPSTYTSSQVETNLVGINKIIITDNDLIVATKFPDVIQVFPFGDYTSTPTQFTVPGDEIIKLVYSNGAVYALTNTSTPMSNIYQLNLSGSGHTSIYTEGTLLDSFAINNDVLVLGPVSGGNMNILPLSNLAATPTGVSTIGVDSMIISGNYLYYLDGGGFKVQKIFGASFMTINDSTLGRCEAQLSGTIAGIPQTLNLQSDSAQNLRMAFDMAYSAIGRKDAPPQAFYYFQSLASHDDMKSGRTLGHMEDAAENFTPDSIGGIMGNLFRDKNCLDIKNEITINGTKSGMFLLTDSIEQQSRLYNYSVSTSNVLQESFVADSSPIAYDLYVSVSFTNALETEKKLLKFSCTSKLGSYEDFEIEGSEEKRRLMLWNTNSILSSRYELYESFEEGTYADYRIAKLKKTNANELNFRRLELSKQSVNRWGSQTTLDMVGGNIFTSQRSHQNIDSNFNSGSMPWLAEYNLSTGQNANVCMSLIADQVSASSIPSCQHVVASGITTTARHGTLSFTLQSLNQNFNSSIIFELDP